MYAMLCTRLDICFVLCIVKRYQLNLGWEHWTAVNNMIKCLKGLGIICWFTRQIVQYPLGTQTQISNQIKILENRPRKIYLPQKVEPLVRGVSNNLMLLIPPWRPNMWQPLRQPKRQFSSENFLLDLRGVPSVQSSITLYCDNSEVVTNSKEPRTHKRAKHI